MAKCYDYAMARSYNCVVVKSHNHAEAICYDCSVAR